jgi:hypothetical protein
MRVLPALGAMLIATGAFAQKATPTVGAKPPVQVKPQGCVGCKLVGTVKETKLWAGGCVGGRA